MNVIEKGQWPTLLIQWIARISSIASIGLVVTFLVGEHFNPVQLTPHEWLGFLFFPCGICVGMIVAWWKESTGGIITVASLLVFYAIHLATSGTFPKGWAWLAFSAPGFLFLLSWQLSRKADS